MAQPLVFISYAREDESTAHRVFFDLKDAGFRPWFDKVHLAAGEVWETEIPKAIKSCDFFLPLLSSTCLDKDGYVQRELQFGLAVLDDIPADADVRHPRAAR